MHRLFLCASLAFLSVALILTGCGQQNLGPAPADEKVSPGEAKPIPPGEAKPGPTTDSVGDAPLSTKTDPDTLPVLPTLSPPTGADKYEASISKAFLLVAEKKDAEALAALKEAQAAQDTDFVKTEIERLQNRIARAEAAQKAIDDIKVVLDAGQGAEASKLAGQALEQYGDTEVAEPLTILKRQADALLSVSLEGNAKKTQFLTEAEAARKANNVRGAVLAYETAIANGAEPGELKATYDDLRAKLASYDDSRAKAAELRKDPYQLEEAATILKAAAQSWDTPQIRQELSEVEVALQNRRDRVAVADFEVIEDIGVPKAGHAIAEELVGQMRPRFDVVERSQAQALLNEMKIDHEALYTNEIGRTEFGKLAKARYVVLGSVNRLGAINVNARLVDTQTGLVIQTARVSAATPEDLSNRLPALGRMLQMNDAEKQAYEKQLAEQARPVVTASATAELPPPPPPPAQAAAPAPPPAPIVMSTPRPPVYGEIAVADFGGFKVIEVGAAPPPPVVIVEAPQPVQQRACFVAVEVGDNCFRRGDFRLALRHFEFALTLNPGNADLRLRVAQCRPLCPPPVQVVVVVPARPRIVVLPFAEFRDPFQVPSSIPPELGVWTAGAFAPYLTNRYDVVDQGELYWWMGRLGLTMRDVLVNPSARLCLGRALGARYFLMGSLREVASFDVSASIIDAELNGQVYGVQTRVQNATELRYRLPELANLMFMPPQQQVIIVQQQQVVQQKIIAAQIEYRKGNFSIAFGMYKEVQTAAPMNVEARSMVIELDFRSRRSGVEAAQVAMWQQQQVAMQAERERQIALAAAAEGARQQARRDIEFMNQANKAELAKRQFLAQQAMVAQAQQMQAANMAAQRAAVLQAAAQIHQNQAVQAQLVQARIDAVHVQQQQALAANEARIAEARRQQSAQVDAVRANINASVEQTHRDMAQRQQQIATHVQTEYDQFVATGKKAEAAGNFALALTAYQNAKHLKPSPEIELMIGGAINGQARAQAALKGDAEKRKLEAQLAQEAIKNKELETAAALQKAKYDAQFKAAQQALAVKEYEQAAKAYRDASAILQTQEALAGIKAAEAEMNRVKATTALEEQKRKAEEKRLGTAAEKLAEGRSALAVKDIPKALAALRSAKALKPGDPDIEKALVEAENLQQEALAAGRKAKEQVDQAATLQRHITLGKQNLTAKQYDGAIVAFTDALRIDAKNAEANAGLQSAQAAQKENIKDAAALAEAKRKRDEYEVAMRQGRAALNLKHYSDALGFFQKAQDTLPGDAASAELIKEATKQQATVAATTKKDPIATLPKKDPPIKTAGKVDDLVAKARAAIKAKDMTAAYQAIVEASKLDPTDADLRKVRGEYETARLAMSADPTAGQKQAMYEAAMSAANTAFTAKRYDDAIAKATEALKQKPGDAAATQLLASAKKADAAADTAAMEAKKKLEAYQQSIRDASDALAAKKYDVAVREAKEALANKPGDPTATRILADAQKGLAANTTPAVDNDKYDSLMKAGRASYSARKFEEALKAFEDALKAKPGDPTATQSIAIVKKAIAAATPAADPKKDAYDSAMKAGRAALASKDYAEAVQSFTAALKADPGDPTATALLKQARDAQTAASTPTTPAVDPKRKELYDQWLAYADKLMAAKKYDEAVEAYGNALRAIPNDPAATKGQAAAKAAMAAKVDPVTPKKDPVTPVVPKKDPVVPKADPAAKIAELMKKAKGEEAASKYADASDTYQDVLALAPTNAEAKKRSSFCQYMDMGTKQLAAGKLADAAASFDQAVKLDPTNAEAKRLLQQARAKKK
ncbi:MAG TPA: tetratricopeptide repeat protein [Gemmataceae bacterium]|jgi:tetratricopeptide (TPR) repeat protein|nr:tetratricopeptide repeat protein [Gemmataceae bacterium]